jgi:hypothetical protein
MMPAKIERAVTGFAQAAPARGSNGGLIVTASSCTTRRQCRDGKSSDVSNFDQAAAFMGLSLLIFRL